MADMEEKIKLIHNYNGKEITDTGTVKKIENDLIHVEVIIDKILEMWNNE